MQNPVFTYTTEMTFLGSFMALLASEISRYDLIEAEQMKLKFMRSISRKWFTCFTRVQTLTLSDEFRSPLHAIIASTEMLQETNPSNYQDVLLSYVSSSANLLLVRVA